MCNLFIYLFSMLDPIEDIIAEQKGSIDPEGTLQLQYYGYARDVVGVKLNYFGRLIFLTDEHCYEYAVDEGITPA